jgi:cell division protein FtsQ
MKRPEGFDRQPPRPSPAAGKPQAPQRGAARRPPVARTAAPPAVRQPKPTEPNPTEPNPPGPKRGRARPETPDADRELRKAAAARRRYERGEVRRFTRRSRRRRTTWLVVIICVVLLGGLVTGAVYSPLLSLKTITITGTSRLDKAQLLKAVDGQLGTPLALVDFGKIRTELSAFPLIRSYVTESQPPDTLVIRISERAPIGVLQTAKGYSVIDPAGVVLQETTTRPANLPVITGSAALTKSTAFTAAVDVLLSLPADLLAKVDSVTAQTEDNVTLTLAGGSIVLWGSDEDSAYKGKVLAVLIANQPSASRYDVTAPNAPVFVPK